MHCQYNPDEQSWLYNYCALATAAGLVPPLLYRCPAAVVRLEPLLVAAGLQTGKSNAGTANMMMATAAAVVLLAAAVSYELPHFVS